MNITDFYSQTFSGNTSYRKPTIEEIAQEAANTAAENVKEECNKDFEEKDPEFASSAASGITNADIEKWNNKQDAIENLDEITDAAANALQPDDIDFSYDETHHIITLTVGENQKTIDAADFVKDGMISGVNLDGTNLVLSFNTDAGADEITVDLSSIIDLGNYYTKDEVDQAINDIDIPNVPEWALAEQKPTYTANEVGALSADTVIPTVPTNISAFTNDAGYLTTETEPQFNASVAKDITAENINAWNNKLDSFTETDPVFSASAAAGISAEDITNWNSKTDNVGTVTGVTMNNEALEVNNGVVNLGNVITEHQDISGKQDVIENLDTIIAGAALGATALQSYTETEPQFNASAAKDITAEDVNAWNGKQDALTFDNQPMEDSDNPVKSKGIKSYVDAQVAEVVKGASVDFDSLGEAQAKYNELNAKYVALHNVVYSMADGEAATEMNPEYVANTISSGNRNVVVEKGTLGDVTIPEVTGSTTVTAPMAVTPKSGDKDTYSTITLTTPNKSFTLTNTTPSDEQNPVNVEVDAPYNDNSTSNTTVYLQGEYENIIVENASIGKASDREAPVVHNITVNNNVDEDVENPKMKNSTIAATFTGDDQNPSVVTSNVPALTITNYNKAVDGDDNPITPPSLVIDAEDTTVTLNSKWDEVNAVVSPDTLIVNGSAHINKLTCAQKVLVKVSKASMIDDVIADHTGVNVGYVQIEVNQSNQSQMTNTAECTLVGNIEKTYGWSFSALSSDYPVWILNDKSINITKERFGVVMLRNRARLDVYGNGNITSQDYGVWTSGEQCVANIYGGNWVCTTHALYAEKGTINVYGGTFRVTGDDKRYVLNCLDASYTASPRKAQINVYGGKFYDFDPSNSMSEPNGPVSFVANGYHVVGPLTDEIGTYYEVVAD